MQIHGSPVRIRLYPSFWIRDRSLQKMRTLTISRKIQVLFTSFYCNGRSPARRQAWDHPKAALAWHLTKTCPFREIEDRISSHLHTTLNKSRDEKLIGACTIRIVLKRKRFTAPKRGCKKTSSEGLEPSISRFVVSRLIQLGHEDIAYNGQTEASMAEWSKALDLSSSIRKNAWVRTPLEASPFALQA